MKAVSEQSRYSTAPLIVLAWLAGRRRGVAAVLQCGRAGTLRGRSSVRHPPPPPHPPHTLPPSSPSPPSPPFLPPLSAAERSAVPTTRNTPWGLPLQLLLQQPLSRRRGGRRRRRRPPIVSRGGEPGSGEGARGPSRPVPAPPPNTNEHGPGRPGRPPTQIRTPRKHTFSFTTPRPPAGRTPSARAHAGFPAAAASARPVGGTIWNL
jgi:hypothetical protein